MCIGGAVLVDGGGECERVGRMMISMMMMSALPEFSGAMAHVPRIFGQRHPKVDLVIDPGSSLDAEIGSTQPPYRPPFDP